VRRFEERDADRIRTIVQQSPEAAQWPQETWRQLNQEGHATWVAESSQGEVVGFLVTRIVATEEAEILNLAIARINRRAGLASQLLRSCIDELMLAKVQRVFLEVRESNAAAIAFYEKYKFVRAGRRPAYYQNPAEAAVLLVRILTA